ncbi:MAG: Ldh family oxidoreductase [Patescibacteria group bacterium]
MIIKLEDLKAVAKKAILNYGYSESEAIVMLDVMLYAQMRGNNQGVVKLIGKGIPKSAATRPIVVEKETALSAFFDGGQNHAMVAVKYVVDVAISKAKKCGIAVVGIHQLNTSSGALGYYARSIADSGLVGMVMCGSMETVAAAGSSQAIFGTNPFAIAVPTATQPMVFDMTTSAMAFFGVVQADTAGVPLPEGIAYDKEGSPTTKASDVLAGGALKSFDGSHKGSGLSMMIQALTGPLLHSYFTGIGDVGSNWAGHLIVAFDPELLGGLASLKEGVSQMIEKVKATKKLPNVDEIFVPGEKGDRLTQAILQSGEIEIEDNLYNELRKIAA